MSGFEVGVLAQLALATVALGAALGMPATVLRGRVAGAAVVALGAAGCLTGGVALAGSSVSGAVSGAAQGAAGGLTLATPVAGLDLGWAPTPLGGLFTLLAGAVAVLAGLYAIGYAHGPAGSRTAWGALAVFVLAMQLVPLSADVVTFLFGWEAMAIGSSVLVLAEHARRPAVRTAGLWYAVMTHLSFLLVAAGLAVLAAQAHDVRFARIAASTPSTTAASLAFLLATTGFASKAGAVPLHVWLPRAHPEAPSHVSALMSAAMVKMGIFGVLLVATVLLPSGPSWWALVLLGLGVPSALYGILQASVASDLKTLLAYSTTENVGLILLAVALAMLTHGSRPAVAATALTAAVLLTISHAAFKATLFLAAGSIVHATGERSLDRMGGLATRMPVTTVALGIGSLGAAALPVTSGFAAEWALLQSLIHADAHIDRLTTALLPLVMAVVALTAGLALLTFAKVFGISALARPRSPATAGARDVSTTMRAAMLLGAALVLGLGLAPGWVARAVATALPPGAVASTATGALVLPGVRASLHPVALSLLALGLTAPVVVVWLVLARRAPREPVELGWGCGGVRTSPRMQYTASSYAEPLLRVFDDALAPTRDVTVSHAEESRHTVRTMAYTQRVADVVEVRVYAPAVAAMVRLGDRARTVQNGSIHRYVAFSFAALLLVLLGVLA